MSRSSRQKRGRPGAAWGRSLTLGISIGVVAFLISVVLVVFLFFAYAKNFVQSELFRRMVEAQLSSALRAKVELSRLRWEGTSPFSERASGQGYQDASFATFEVAGLRADLDLSVEQFKRHVWNLPEVTISQLDVVFSKSGRLAESSPLPEVAPESQKRPAKSGSLVAQLIPRELELNRMRFATLNLYWNSPGYQVSATGMESVLRPVLREGTCAMKVRGGSVQGPALPKLSIDTLDLQWKGRDIFVNEAKLHNDANALLSLQGDIRLGESGKPGSMRLDAEVNGLSVARLAQERGGQSRVQGDLEITARIEGDPGDVKNSRQEGRITLRNGVVETFPVLQMLARFTGSKRFERIALRDGGGAKFVREKGRTNFSEIDFQSDGLARLTGDLAVQDGQVEGLLNLGVIPGTLSWIPAAEQKIFTESRDGYLWTPVRVTGPVDHPQHDLVSRLAAAGVETVVDSVGRILDGTAKSQPGTDPSVSGTATETLGKAVDMGRDLLKGFLK